MSSRGGLVRTHLHAQSTRPIAGPSGASRSTRVWKVGAACALALPVIGYFWFIHRYSVNAVWWDQWADVRLLRHWYSGGLGLSDLWAQHGYHRIFFPNLIVLLLSKTVRYNVVIEQYLSGVMLVLATGLFVAAHKRRSPSTPLLFYFPMVVLLLSFVQYQDTLWGFQMAWYLVLLSLATALFLLDRPAFTRLALAGAISAAVVGSFSSQHGLLIWPAGLVLLYQRRRSMTVLAVWCACAAATIAIYFAADFNLQVDSTLSLSFMHPIRAIEFYLMEIAGIFGQSVVPNSPGNHLVLVMVGALILVIAVWVSISIGVRRDRASGAPLGVALICYGLLFAASVTIGRISEGLAAAGGSTHTAFDLLIVAGVYLALSNVWSNVWNRALRQPSSSRLASPSTAVDRILEGSLVVGNRLFQYARRASWKARILVVMSVMVLGVIAGQILIGNSNGLRGAGYWRDGQGFVVDVTVNIDKAPIRVANDTLLAQGCNCPAEEAQLPELVDFLRAHRLAMFGTDAATVYGKWGLTVSHVAPATRITLPRDGAVLTGSQFLNATVRTDYRIKKVEFQVTSDNFRTEMVVSGRAWEFGWLGGWLTKKVSNGSYQIEVVAFDAVGNVSRSPPVSVRVAN